jgi:hypothetical protein
LLEPVSRFVSQLLGMTADEIAALRDGGVV